MSTTDADFDLNDLAYFIYKKWFVVVFSSIIFGIAGMVSAKNYNPPAVTELSIKVTGNLEEILFPIGIAALNSSFSFDINVLNVYSRQTQGKIDEINGKSREAILNKVAVSIIDQKVASDFCAETDACADFDVLELIEKYKLVNSVRVVKVFNEPAIAINWEALGSAYEEEMIIEYIKFVMQYASNHYYANAVLLPLERIKYSDLKSILSLHRYRAFSNAGVEGRPSIPGEFSIENLPLAYAKVGSKNYKNIFGLEDETLESNNALAYALHQRIEQVDSIPVDTPPLLEMTKKKVSTKSPLQQPKAAGVAGVIIGGLLALVLLVFVRAYRQ